MNNSTFKFSGTKSGEKRTTPAYSFVSYLQKIGQLQKKKKTQKRNKFPVPHTTVVYFTGKLQCHKAHTHPHRAALFPSAHKAAGKGATEAHCSPRKGNTE